jgi:hypothetical protein
MEGSRVTMGIPPMIICKGVSREPVVRAHRIPLYGGIWNLLGSARSDLDPCFSGANGARNAMMESSTAQPGDLLRMCHCEGGRHWSK